MCVLVCLFSFLFLGMHRTLNRWHRYVKYSIRKVKERKIKTARERGRVVADGTLKIPLHYNYFIGHNRKMYSRIRRKHKTLIKTKTCAKNGCCFVLLELVQFRIDLHTIADVSFCQNELYLLVALMATKRNRNTELRIHKKPLSTSSRKFLFLYILFDNVVVVVVYS